MNPNRVKSFEYKAGEEKKREKTKMACRSMLRSAIIVEPFQFQFQFKPLLFDLNPNKRGGFRCRTIKARPFHGGGGGVIRCSHNDKPSFHDDQGPPQEAVLKAISGGSLQLEPVGMTLCKL
ncbi:hypothetical protein RYX36_014920 [Vicia faba]